MKWLQWSKIDLEFGLGGVEEHSRCLARELRKLGVDVRFSRDPKDLADPQWDVIHTHGNGIAPRLSRNAVLVHTLHGTTLGRMAACGEWLWPRGYLAEIREIKAVFSSDVILSVHPELSLFKLAKSLGRVTRVCGNGWDSGNEGTLPESVLKEIREDRPLWIYVGRGDDIVKGADRVIELFRSRPRMQLFAVPGSGFEAVSGVFKTGRLTSAEVGALMQYADGILMPSRYEGNSLVVLEALASGLQVLATPVGGVPCLPPGVLGVEAIPAEDREKWLSAIDRLERSLGDKIERKERREKNGKTNRALLPRWADVARAAVDAVEEARKKK